MTSSTFWWANEVCGSVPKALAILGTPTVVAVLWYKDEVDVPVVVRDVRIPVAHLDVVRDVRQVMLSRMHIANLDNKWSADMLSVSEASASSVSVDPDLARCAASVVWQHRRTQRSVDAMLRGTVQPELLVGRHCSRPPIFAGEIATKRSLRSKQLRMMWTCICAWKQMHVYNGICIPSAEPWYQGVSDLLLTVELTTDVTSLLSNLGGNLQCPWRGAEACAVG